MGCIWRRVDGADFALASRFVALVLPMLPPITPPCGTPFFDIFTIPISIRVIGMVMIGLVGVATFDKSGTGATSILQAVIWVSSKRQLRNATLAPS
jgi:hypothetical protein